MVYKKEYYETFKNKNQEKINELHICDVCGGKYKYYRKSQHNHTKKHMENMIIIHLSNDEPDKAELLKQKIKEKFIRI